MAGHDQLPLPTATGTNVTTGSVLFRVVDASQVHVVGQIPEAETARARLASTAEIELPGQANRLPAGRLVNVGKVLDPQSRTLPIRIAPGSALTNSFGRSFSAIHLA